MMLRGVRVVSDDQECLVNFSMSGPLMFTCVIQSNDQCRFRGSMVFGHFRDMPGRFLFRRQRVLFIDRMFLADNLL